MPGYGQPVDSLTNMQGRGDVHGARTLGKNHSDLKLFGTKCNGQRLDLQSIQAWLQGPQGSSPRLGTVPARSQGQQEPTGIADRRRGPQVWRLASPCRSRRSRNSSKSTGPPHHMHRRSQRALTHTDTSYNTTQALSTVPR